MKRLILPLDLLTYPEQDLKYMEQQGFEEILTKNLQPEVLIGPLLGSSYKRKSLDEEVPHYFDCTSLSKWYFSHFGINLSRFVLNQASLGNSVSEDSLAACDLVFIRRNVSQFSYFDHVGVAKNSRFIYHASNSSGVTETSFRDFRSLTNHPIRIRRLLPSNYKVLEVPPNNLYTFLSGQVLVVSRILQENIHTASP